MIPLHKISSFYKYGTAVADTEDDMKEICEWIDVPFTVSMKSMPPFQPVYLIERSEQP